MSIRLEEAPPLDRDGASSLSGILDGESRPAVNQLRELAVFPHLFQAKPPESLLLRKERNPRPQQHRGHLDNQTVHQIPVQQRGQEGVPADDPNVFLPAQTLHKRRRVPADGGKARLVQRPVGEDVIFRRGVHLRRVPRLFQLPEGPPPHESHVHVGVKVLIARVLRRPRLVEPVQLMVLPGEIAVQCDAAVKIDAH